MTNNADRTSLIDDDRSACLCDAGLPGYVAAVAVAADGRTDLVLANEELVGDDRHTYNHATPEARHEQLGPLPLEYVRRITINNRRLRGHRCGRRTKSGTVCRMRVPNPGDACEWHRTSSTERTNR